jgi:hypothetical protein
MIFHFDIKAVMMFTTDTTVASNKSISLIGQLPMGDIFMQPCLIWTVSFGKALFIAEKGTSNLLYAITDRVHI